MYSTIANQIRPKRIVCVEAEICLRVFFFARLYSRHMHFGHIENLLACLHLIWESTHTLEEKLPLLKSSSTQFLL
jgi:hypothetical protein